jgi:hypothetical protein
MKTFFAVSSKLVIIGGLMDCKRWADSLIQNHKAKIVKIFVARPDEKQARIVFEITKEGMREVSTGRTIPITDLKRKLNNGKKT